MGQPKNVFRLKLIIYGLILVIMFLLLGIEKCNAQNTEKNNIFISYAPQDNAVGLRYDRFLPTVGVYSSVSYGNYILPYGSYLNDHLKVAGGLIFSSSHGTYLSVGMAGHNYGKYYESEKWINGLNKRVLLPLSFEFGFTAEIQKYLVGARIDVVKREGLFEFGIMF